jgi:dihydrofolate synthase/folylpolyglutamate synthase
VTAARRAPALADALAYLDAHVNFETAPARRAVPTLERMRELCRALGDPQGSYPVVHITGTNGKGSTARMTTALFQAHGLNVGTYTSPHLQRPNERIAWNSEPIDDATLAEGLLAIAPIEEHLGVRLTHFELLTAAAYSWFADVAIDIAVVEVGMGGRWDATNVVDGTVAVVTNVGLDHAEVIGPTRLEIAIEKSGIVKDGATLVLGETDPAMRAPFENRSAGQIWTRDADFGEHRNRVALGGRLLDLYTPLARYDEVFVPLHGAHQGDNAACALTATESFFGRPLDLEVVNDAFAAVRVPGRCEVVGRHPLIVLDGAHNPDGARALSLTLEEDFSGRVPDVLLVGLTAGRDPVEMLTALRAERAKLVVACPPPHPRAMAPAEVVAAAEAMGVPAETRSSVADAIESARGRLTDDDFLLVTGSLYLVGEARTVLVPASA